jgi:hypothetical protein
MVVALFKLSESSGVGYLAAIALLNAQVMVEHLMVNDTQDDILWHVALIQRRMDPNCFCSFRVAGKFNGILIPDSPVSSPTDRAINQVCEVFTIDLVK